jgi:hypothetical protein
MAQQVIVDITTMPDCVDLTASPSEDDEVLVWGYAPASSEGSQDELVSASQRGRLLRSNASLSVIPTKGKRKISVGFYDAIFRLRYIMPPASSVRKNTKKHEQHTDDFGKYLILRDFPLLSYGRWTLCFLLTPNIVAKVPRYGSHEYCDLEDKEGETEEQKEERHLYNVAHCAYCRFIFERQRDLAMCADYPTGFAKTELIWIIDSGRTFSVYVQERLDGPFRVNPDVTKDANSFVLTRMVTNNPNAKQFGYTREETMLTPINDDISIQLGPRKWLKCIDYE